MIKIANKKWSHDRNHRLYRIWKGVNSRCYKSWHHEYHRYGGRGIAVCQDWRSSYDKFFEWAIMSGYNDTLTIERIDVNGDYCPDNCTWITRKEQACNRGTSVLIEYNGSKKSCAELSRLAGFKDKHTILERVRRGMSIEEAMTMPSKKGKTYCIAGEVGTIQELADKHGLNRTTLERRVMRGVPHSIIFEQPKRTNGGIKCQTIK